MKTLVTLMVLLLATTIMAQEPVKQNRRDDSMHEQNLKTLRQLSQMADTSQTYRIVNCLINYRTERTYAMGFAAAGGGLMLVASGVSNSGTRQDITVAAGICGFLSAVTFIRAERWLGRSQLLLTGKGLLISF